jgi:hypothetical protein
MMSKGPLERRERLSRICKHIIADPSSVDGDVVADFKSTALRYANTQYGCPEQVLKRIYCDEGELGDLMRGAVDIVVSKSQLEVSPATGALYSRTRSFLDMIDDDDRDRERDGDDDDGDAIAKARTRHDVGARGLAAATSELALDLIRHHRRRLGLVSKGGGQLEAPMKDTVYSIMKDGSVAGVCAAIVAKGTTTITEHELVQAVSKVAAERYPELSESQAFAKVYSDPTEGRVLRQAINVAKESLAQTMLGPGLPVQVVGGPDAKLDAANDDQSEIEQARAELMRIGRKQWPRLTENEVFERAFCDPRNATLVARLYQRPTPTSIYPMPREWLQGEGSQHAKSDHGSAYNDLMEKAEAYQTAHPELLDLASV